MAAESGVAPDADADLVDEEAPSDTPEAEEPDHEGKLFLSSSAFMLFNFVPFQDPPSYYELDLGIRLTPKDVLIVEAITWQYHAPLGVPWGPMNGNPESFYPGKARDIGIGLAYQRFVWKGAYTALHATPFHQRYYDEAGDRIQTGFQLFMALRFGYHIDLFHKRMFIEPSVAFTSWPIHTNLPASFAALDARWPTYFLFEPGLDIGINL